MKKNTITLFITGIGIFSGLTGCSGNIFVDRSAATQENIEAGLRQEFAVNSRACYFVKKWPVQLSKADLPAKNYYPTGLKQQMDALQNAGLVTDQVVSVDQIQDVEEGGTPTEVTKTNTERYTLTAEGQKYAKTLPNGGYKDICYGNQTFGKLLKWNKTEDGKVWATYTYTVSNFAPWTGQQEIQKAFPSIQTAINQNGQFERNVTMEYTKGQWRPIFSY